MNVRKTLFAQLMNFLPWKTFHRIVSSQRRVLVKVYDMRRSIPRDDLRVTDIPRESARHRDLSLAQSAKLYNMGLRAGGKPFDVVFVNIAWCEATY